MLVKFNDSLSVILNGSWQHGAEWRVDRHSHDTGVDVSPWTRLTFTDEFWRANTDIKCLKNLSKVSKNDLPPPVAPCLPQPEPNLCTAVDFEWPAPSLELYQLFLALSIEAIQYLQARFQRKVERQHFRLRKNPGEKMFWEGCSLLLLQPPFSDCSAYPKAEDSHTQTEEKAPPTLSCAAWGS